MRDKIIIKRLFFVFAAVASIIAIIYISRLISADHTKSSIAEAKQGPFEITVSAHGELLAENSTDILGPRLPNVTTRRGRWRRSIRAMPLRILDIVPEGTIVRKGDYIAELDRTDYENMLTDELQRLEDYKVMLEEKKLDTALTLSSLRFEIKDQAFNVEVATITLEQSAYEPPAIIHQAEVDLDREKRKLEQKKKIYQLRKSQTLKEMTDINLTLDSEKRMIENLQTYIEGFVVTSPSDGMVIYKRNRNGTKRKAGSSINPFDMVIATLPDLSSMLSKVYISEIDIRKIIPGQKVNITVDAFRNRAYTGNVLSIARIGEQLPNSDTKMFEVLIKVEGNDQSLRPSMTTGNKIVIKTIEKAIYVPLESVRTDSEGVTYVYTLDKIKQQIILGESNNDDIIVEKGLEPGKEIYITRPADAESFTFSNV